MCKVKVANKSVSVKNKILKHPMLFSIGSMLYLLDRFSYWIITKQYLSSDYKLPFSSTRLIRPLALILNQTIKGLFHAKFHNFIWSIVEVNLVQTKSVSPVTFLIRGTLETRFLVFLPLIVYAASEPLFNGIFNASCC